VPRKFFIKTYNKNKNLASQKCILTPKNLKPG